MLFLRPSHPKLSDDSLSVLACTVPTFRARARSSSWRGAPRILELRANVVLLLRDDDVYGHGRGMLTARNIERVHEVSKSEGPLLNDDGTEILILLKTQEELRYAFGDRESAALFRDALKRAMRAHARAPSYVVLGKVPNIERMKRLRPRLMNGTARRGSTIVLARSWEPHESHSRLVTIKSYSLNDDVSRRMAINERNTLKYLIERKKAISSTPQFGDKPFDSQFGVSSLTFIPNAIHTFETRTSLVVAFTDRHAIPLCDLHTLLHRLPQRRLPPSVARVLFAELLLALYDLHTNGISIAYGDIRPRNVWLTRGGHIRLCEFSTARIDTSDSSGVNGEKAASGGEAVQKLGGVMKRAVSHRYSQQYPEYGMIEKERERYAQYHIGWGGRKEPDRYGANGGGKAEVEDEEDRERREYRPPEGGVSRAGDVWSLGVMLMEMLTGTRRASGRVVRDLLDPAQRTILARMLARNANARASVKEVMGMRWLRSVDFDKVRREAHVGMPRDEVLKLGRKVGISAWNAGDSAFQVDLNREMHMDKENVRRKAHDPEHSDQEEDSDIESESDYAESEWSRMTREFCRVDGAFDPDMDDITMKQITRLRLKRKKRGFRRKVEVEHGRVLGFGLNLSNDRIDE